MSNVECGVRPSRLEAGLDARVDAVLEQALSERRLVGAVVLVAKDGAPAYRRVAGWADREAGLSMWEDALFRLASVSKPIVSTAAMALAARRRLDLDEDIARWLPEFRARLADGAPARITPRQLLSHTAGLGYRFFEEDGDGPYARAGVSDGMDADGLTLTECHRLSDARGQQFCHGRERGNHHRVTKLAVRLSIRNRNSEAVTLRGLKSHQPGAFPRR
jgi:CubicO group peptidase (beta-lactamase class C family)